MTTKKETLYLVLASWRGKDGDYKHRAIHSHYPTPEAACAAFVKERKEWEDCEAEKLGWIGNSLVRVTLFETVSMNDRAWVEWRDKAQEERRQRKHQEERNQDMVEIQRIVKKWGASALEVLALAAGDADD